MTVRALSVQYPDGTRAVNGVDFTLNPGVRLALVGESGSGKSSMAKAILNLLPARTRIRGSIRLEGRELLGLPEREWRTLRGMRIGFVSQDPFTACNPVFRVWTNVAEAWRAHRLKAEKSHIMAALVGMGIENAPSRVRLYPHQWSGGMLQRAEIVSGSAHGPSLIIADEPTSALDADLATGILRLLADREVSVLMISHDLKLVSKFAHEIAVCYAGRIVEQGRPAEIATKPRHPYTQALLRAIPQPGKGLPGTLAGAAPDLKEKIRGCPFSPRCVHARRICFEQAPLLTEGLACHLERSPKPKCETWTVVKNNHPVSVIHAGNDDGSAVASLTDVTKSYRYKGRRKNILQGIHLSIFSGEIVGICGSSGSGKSTLLKIMAGLNPPDDGGVYHAGHSVWHFQKHRAKRILPRNGYVMSVFQNPLASLDRRWPVWRTITEPLSAPHRKHHISVHQRKIMAGTFMAEVGLDHLTGRERPQELSIGQCQRISILRALAAEPALIAADEPTSALDVTSSAGIYRLLREKADAGTAIIIVSHDENALRVLSDRLYRLEEGGLQRLPLLGNQDKK